MVALLKVSTAVSIKLGPFVDATDGFTAETALTISQADVRLAKNDGNWAQKNDATSATHEENGWYETPLNSTDTNTLGQLVVAVNETGARPVYREYMVVPANVYDSLVANTNFLFADAVRINGTNQTAVDVGALLPPISNATVIRSNTLQGGAAGSATLDAGASSTDDFYKGNIIVITSGSAIGQVRLISAYNGTTKVATIIPAWNTTPGAHTFVIVPSAQKDVGLIEGLDASDQIVNRTFDALGVYDVPTQAELVSEVATVPDALLDQVNGVEANLTLRQHLRLAAAALYGISLVTAGNRVYRDTTNAKSRIVATVSNGDRSVVTLDKS